MFSTDWAQVFQCNFEGVVPRDSEIDGDKYREMLEAFNEIDANLAGDGCEELESGSGGPRGPRPTTVTNADVWIRHGPTELEEHSSPYFNLSKQSEAARVAAAERDLVRRARPR